jgi:cytochrome c biogenesis protein CcmG/thiol:disulfide interchange protein DsbE
VIEPGQGRVAQPPLRSVPGWSLALPVLVVLVATALGVGVVWLNSSPKSVTVEGGTAAVGAEAPAFSSWNLEGKQVALREFKGHPVLLSFWATWCTACQDELPALQQARDRYRSAGLVVLAVDYRETDASRMSRYLAGLHVNLESVIDPQGAIAGAYGVDVGLPVNVWLDRDLVVSRITTGAMTPATLDSAAAQLAGPPA